MDLVSLVIQVNFPSKIVVNLKDFILSFLFPEEKKETHCALFWQRQDDIYHLILCSSSYHELTDLYVE